MPKWGKVAEEVAPPWVITRMMKGELLLNLWGGFSMFKNNEIRSCFPGDYVVFDEHQGVVFVPAEEVT
jgi:hypothetical protein